MTDRPSDSPDKPDRTYADWSETDLETLTRIDASALADARADALRSDPELAALLEAEDLPSDG